MNFPTTTEEFLKTLAHGKEVACGYLSYEADKYGDLRPYLCDNGKIVMRDVNDWMPMPNVTSVLKK